MEMEILLHAHPFDNRNNEDIIIKYHEEHDIHIYSWFDTYSAVAFQLFSNTWLLGFISKFHYNTYAHPEMEVVDNGREAYNRYLAPYHPWY